MTAWHGLGRVTREEQLAQWEGLATDAAASALADERSGLAAELLDQGRSVIWAQVLDMRTDLTRLSEKAPHLALQLDGIRNVLDVPMLEIRAAE